MNDKIFVFDGFEDANGLDFKLVDEEIKWPEEVEEDDAELDEEWDNLRQLKYRGEQLYHLYCLNEKDAEDIAAKLQDRPTLFHYGERTGNMLEFFMSLGGIKVLKELAPYKLVDYRTDKGPNGGKFE